MKFSVSTLLIFVVFFCKGQTHLDSVAGTYEERRNFIVNSINPPNPPGYCIVPLLNPGQYICTLTLSKNKYASLKTVWPFSYGITSVEYGKWKLKGDTIIATFSKFESSLFIINVNEQNGIRKLEKPVIHYYVWKEEEIVEIHTEDKKTYSRKDLNL